MFTKRLSIRAVLPLSLILLTACGGPATDDSNATTGSDTAQPPAETPPVETLPPVDQPIDDPDANPTDEVTGIALALSGEGVLMVDAQSGKSQTVAFDTALETSQTAISAALGDPTDTAENAECGAGPMTFVTWSNGFTINAIDDQFVGWTVRAGTESANLTTVDGVGLGSTLIELEENYDVGVIESSLGTEFNASNILFGLLDANEPDGIVTYLWAGIACNFR